MKKCLIIFLAIILLCCVSCSSKSEYSLTDEYTSNSTDSSEQSNKLIGISLPSEDYGWNSEAARLAQAAANDIKTNYLLEYSDDYSSQIEVLKEFADKGCNVIVFLPCEYSENFDFINDLNTKGSEVFIVSSQDITSVRYRIYAEEYEIGAKSAEYLNNNYDGGTITILEYNDFLDKSNEKRLNGFKDNISDKFVIANSYNCADCTIEAGRKAMQNVILDNDGKTDILYCVFDEIAVGAYLENSEEKASLNTLISSSGMQYMFDIMSKDTNTDIATFLYPPSVAATCVKAADKYCMGEDVPRIEIAEIQTITKENVNDFIDYDSLF